MIPIKYHGHKMTMKNGQLHARNLEWLQGCCMPSFVIKFLLLCSFSFVELIHHRSTIINKIPEQMSNKLNIHKTENNNGVSTVINMDVLPFGGSQGNSTRRKERGRRGKGLFQHNLRSTTKLLLIVNK